MKSLADVLRDVLHPHAGGEAAHIYRNYGQHLGEEERSPYVLPSQNPSGHQTPTPPATAAPKHDEVLNHLGELANDYHVPAKVVYSLAMAESSLNAEIPRQANYQRDKHNQIVHDKDGNPVVKSYDYGLMQINSARIGHDVVKDPSGHRFKI